MPLSLVAGGAAAFAGGVRPGALDRVDLVVD
jgi:hypothetical protein